MTAQHVYPTRLTWAGSTGQGYDAYSRAHHVETEPAPLSMSADPHFGGDPSLLNPEQLLVAAASSCQLLSFLAVAARARLDVTGYTDAATGRMPQGRRMWVSRIELNPRVALAPGSRIDQLQRLTEVAHRECFIASSLRSEMVIDARFSIDGEQIARVTVR